MTQVRIDRATVQAAFHGASTTRHLTVAAGATDEVGALFIAAFGSLPAIVIADATTFGIAGARVQRSLASAEVITGKPHVFPVEAHLSPGYERIAPLCEAILAAPEGTIPVAVGSGTINDLVKRAAFETNRPYMVVATAASMDGYTASGAALIVDGFKQTVECAAPVAVVADTEILTAAPARMTAAGYGDLIGKITAGADWLIADALDIEPIIPNVWSMVQDPLRAIVAHPEHLHDRDSAPAAIEQLFLGLVITGLAIQAT
ncbi:MAG: iron-containing alcohol dehydrogenase [Thermomicrobiales bacterium]